MNRRTLARVAYTALASPTLMIAAYELDGTRFRWIAVPFWAPGVFVVTRLLPHQAYAARPAFYMQLAVMLNFVLIWMVLLFLSRRFERLLKPKREQA